MCYSPQMAFSDPHLRDEEWRSPLGLAIVSGRLDEVERLLRLGADPNAPAQQDLAPLMLAVAHRRIELIPLLLRAGAVLDQCDPRLGSALSMATVNSDHQAARVLVDAGISTELRNAEGARALHLAAYLGCSAVVELVLARGSPVDCPTIQGGTPLRAAAAQGHLGLVRLLLSSGADPGVVDAFEKRPIDYAREGGHSEVVALLEGAKEPASPPCECPITDSLAVLLPPRQDATLHGVIHGIESGDAVTRSGASALEAPSLTSAIRAEIGASFEISFPTGGEADPRFAVRPVKLLLWRYGQDGRAPHEAEPAVPRPKAELLLEISRVATYPYSLATWSKAAATAAAQKLASFSPEDVLSAMVHPPPAPPYLRAWDWAFRFQVAAGLVASHMGREPWKGSSRQRAIEDVLDGPADWSNSAAVIALLDVGRRDLDARRSVQEALLRCVRRPLNPPAYQHAIRPASLALLELPGVDEGVRRVMRELVAD
jgi:hypothetical protein